MESQRGKTNNTSKHFNGDDKLRKDVEEMWTKFSRKGPRYDERDFEYFFSSVKNRGNTDEYVRALQKTFQAELEHVRKYARKYTKKILENLGRGNFTDSQVWEYISKQAKKHNFSRPITDAIYREVSHRISEYPNRSAFFRYTPKTNTKLSSTLGFTGAENFSNVKVSKEDQDILKDIMLLDETNKMTYLQVVDQSLQYTDTAITAVAAQYRPDRHNVFQGIHPVIAALYIPKIPVIDEVTLLPSITNVVKARVNNEPLVKRPEYDLLYNMVHDKNEFVCDRNLWKDLKARAEIQVALWRTVLAVRTGRCYDEAGSVLLATLDRCKFYRYEAFDLIHTGDEGDIIRRLFSVFSFKPVYVQTLPIVANYNLINVAPFSNLDLYNGKIDMLPIINLRLNQLDGDIVDLESIFNQPEIFWDSTNNLFVPSMTRILDTKGVLVVYVHRKNLALQITRFDGPFTFRDLPKTDRQLLKINKTPVAVQPVLRLDIPNTDQTHYALRSVVSIKTFEFEDNNVANEVIQGSVAYISQENDLIDGTWFKYDPSGATVTAMDQNQNLTVQKPITEALWENQQNTDESVALHAATLGVLLVYTKSA